MSRLVLVRHGTSEYNKRGLWTGLTDVALAPEGYDDARFIAEMIKDIDFCRAHVSRLTRAQQTLDEIKKILDKNDIDTHCHEALNERDYGVHTGKNKWQLREELGDEAFNTIRRGWDVVIMEGENLKEVYERVVPYYQEHILPQLVAGDDVLVVSHGNTLRALIKYLEDIDDEKIAELEFNFGEVYCYDVDANSAIVNKEVRTPKVARKH